MNVRPPPNRLRSALVFLFAFGLGFCVIAACLAVRSASFVDTAARAEGIVVAIKKGTLGKTWPIVDFNAASGTRIEFQSDVPNRWFMVIGTHVDVLFDKHDISNARIDSFNDLWGVPFLFGVMGLFSLGLGFTVLRFLGRRSPGIEGSGSNFIGGS